MKPLNIIAAFAAVSIFGISCEKGIIANIPNPPNSSTGPILYKTEFIQGYPGSKVVTVYNFNTQGLDSAEVNTVYDKDGLTVLTTYTRAFKYDGNGKLLQYDNINDGTLSYSTTFKRDHRGRIVKTIVAPAGADLTYGFAYNDKDQVTGDTTFYYTGELAAYLTFGYDDNGNAVTQDTYTGYYHPVQHDGTFTWTYDDKPNPYYSTAFREVSLALNAVLRLSVNNVIAEYAGSEGANIPVTYDYFDDGLIKSVTSHYTQNSVNYTDVTNYFYK